MILLENSIKCTTNFVKTLNEKHFRLINKLVEI